MPPLAVLPPVPVTGIVAGGPRFPPETGPPIPPAPPIPPLPDKRLPPPDPRGGGGGGGGGGGLPGVRDTTEFDPELQDQTREAIARLLGGGALPGLDLRENLIRGETANAQRDARFAIDDRAASRGGVAGADTRAFGRINADLLTSKLGALANARDSSARFGLAQTQAGIAGSQQEKALQIEADRLGINRDLGIRGQDLQNIISKRAASVQRFAITTQAEISREQLEFRREGLAQEILEQNRQFGLATDQQQIDKALNEAGLANDAERIRIAQADQAARERQNDERIALTDKFGTREADRGDLALQTERQLQEWLINQVALQQTGFGGFPNSAAVGSIPPGFDPSQFNVPGTIQGGIPPVIDPIDLDDYYGGGGP